MITEHEIRHYETLIRMKTRWVKEAKARIARDTAYVRENEEAIKRHQAAIERLKT